ncbi:MAG: GNAT family N-acetyltransferase [Legionellales bacterium]|nr:GNAT family N-acetyltransferase [Legionellales bacterium]
MLDWYWSDFNDLTLNQLYELLALRSQVFVVEQHCFYQDLDGQDQTSHHLLGYDSQKILQAYLRCYPIDSHNITIGRVVIAATQRQQGIGKVLMTHAIDFCRQQYPNHRIVIHAQYRLIHFYQELQFTACSEPFDQAGILHIRMERLP